MIGFPDKSKIAAPPCAGCKGKQDRTFGGTPICPACHPSLYRSLIGKLPKPR